MSGVEVDAVRRRWNGPPGDDSSVRTLWLLDIGTGTENCAQRNVPYAIPLLTGFFSEENALVEFKYSYGAS